MTKKQLHEFRGILEEKRDQIYENARRTLKTEIELSDDDLPDEMDMASSVYEQNLSLRLRGRERHLLDKVDLALSRIDDNSFGICEECEEKISLTRLRARPVTTLCIQCKEDQEQREKAYV